MVGQSPGGTSLIGRELGHYRVADRIGAGGMGDVYLALDQHLAREVAIKVLAPGSFADEGSRKRFHNEAIALSVLNHPNIATIYDFDRQQDIDFLVMEFVPGITLSDKLADGPLPESEVIALGTQIAEGLSAAHEHGVIHRDLKPGNLRVTDDGRLKILDFGLAKLRIPVSATAITQSLIETHAFAGTLPYMAPEQLLGAEIDGRTDIHAAGSVLYEMATGHRPFAETERSKLIGAILRQHPFLPDAPKPPLSRELRRIIGKCLEKNPNRRYQSAKELAGDLRQMGMASATNQKLWLLPSMAPWVPKLSMVLILGLLLVVGLLLFRPEPHPAPTIFDTVVLADFINSTGDSVFDGALKQALAVQLEQSPFLSILPQTKIQETLHLMGRSGDETLSPELAREVCQRLSGNALVWGSVASLGAEYVIGLTAANCRTGDYLANVQVQAKNKETVLTSLEKATSDLRRKMGESASSMERFDAPIEEATTPSLEALKAYSLGRQAFTQKGSLAAIPFFEQAVDIDPNFAMAHAALAVVEGNLYRMHLERDAAEKAFALRSRVSSREKFRISAFYYMQVIGDLQRASETHQLWAQTYPKDDTPHDNQAAILAELGKFQEASNESRKALALSPDEWASYFNLSLHLLAQNEPAASEATIKQALQRKVGSPDLFSLPLYQIAFLSGNQETMSRLVMSVAGLEMERELTSVHSDTQAYYGRLGQARFFSRQAVNSELRAGSREAAALWEANAALREAECGSPALARRGAATSLAATRNWQVEVLAALALARIGDTRQAKTLIRDIEKNNSSNTRLRFYWLPSIKAAIEMREGSPKRAIEALEPTVPFELGAPLPLQLGTMYPAYLRGQAYLLLHDGVSASIEFQKLVDHQGIVLNFPLGALAHLQLARAYLISGDTTKARTGYKRFLALWKDADPDIAVLRQAKREYLRLP